MFATRTAWRSTWEFWIVGGAQNHFDVLESFSRDPAIEVLDPIRLNVLGIDAAIRADPACEAGGEPAAARTDISDATRLGNVQGVHHSFGLLPAVPVGRFEDGQVVRGQTGCPALRERQWSSQRKGRRHGRHPESCVHGTHRNPGTRLGRRPGPAAYNWSMINVTEAAAEKINELLTEENRVGAGLRVFVQGGGCSGFQYGLMIDEGEGDESSDQVFEVNGVRVRVDPISLRYLKGAEVDFVDNNMGGGFTIKNPNAKSTCGCGSSFQAKPGRHAVQSATRRADKKAETVPVSSASEFVDRHRPAGGRRSGKRDFIVHFFLRQTGHLSADELVADPRGRRTRQPRDDLSHPPVDGRGGHRPPRGFWRRTIPLRAFVSPPRHFHLLCRTCQQSFEFLSSDIETLVEDVCAARKFDASQTVLQVYGICDACQAGRPPAPPKVPARNACLRATLCAWRLRRSSPVLPSTRRPPSRRESAGQARVREAGR